MWSPMDMKSLAGSSLKRVRGEQLEESQACPQANMFVPPSKDCPPFSVALLSTPDQSDSLMSTNKAPQGAILQLLGGLLGIGKDSG